MGWIWRCFPWIRKVLWFCFLPWYHLYFLGSSVTLISLSERSSLEENHGRNLTSTPTRLHLVQVPDVSLQSPQRKYFVKPWFVLKLSETLILIDSCYVCMNIYYEYICRYLEICSPHRSRFNKHSNWIGLNGVPSPRSAKTGTPLLNSVYLRWPWNHECLGFLCI